MTSKSLCADYLLITEGKGGLCSGGVLPSLQLGESWAPAAMTQVEYHMPPYMMPREGHGIN